MASTISKNKKIRKKYYFAVIIIIYLKINF